MLCSILLAVSLLNMERSQVSISIDADRDTIDPGRSVFLDMRIVSAKGIEVQEIDLRSRVRGRSHPPQGRLHPRSGQYAAYRPAMPFP